ncbi:MAG: cytochrome ubiquinol oxidase subunit I, partial [Solirubrobacteraceae bacterium]|nr:cytochrome ubiquinol oxidase subunit I [Solirubrobacteraceae bacterium]
NFAIGVVTGIVQEFQFGMAWSEYSRYVGDIFGAPLAIEGLVAFFLESTFLGLWIFGWDRLPKKIHLATIWMVAIGTSLSAYFILAANSWMQHPVGYTINEELGRAELTSILAVLTNSTAVYAFFHVVIGAFATAATVLLAVSAWHLYRERRVQRGPEHHDVFLKSAKLSLTVMLVASLATAVVGHFNGQLMTEQQPMKMAAAEALWETESGAGLSLLTIAPFDKNPERPSFELKIPYLASFMATDDPNGTIRGINELQAEYEQKFGPGEYYPIIGLTYWTFRAMMGAGIYMIAFGALGLLLWKRKVYEKRWFLIGAFLAAASGYIAHIAGWVFAEVGRQPWVVYGLQKTSEGVSNISPGTVLTSFIVLVSVYGVMAFIGFKLFLHYVRLGVTEDDTNEAGERHLALTY